MWFICFCVWGCVWGFVTNKVIENKGYDENWFWWGFFFGFFALIIAATKSENHYGEYIEPNWAQSSTPNRTLLSQGGWLCACGRTNPSYTGTCACGATKDGSVGSKATSLVDTLTVAANQAEVDKIKSEENRTLANGGWSCRRCGKVNPEFIGFCLCGMTRGQSKTIDQRLQKEEEEKELAEKTKQESITEAITKFEEIDKFEEIMKYKELLDAEIISEEEYNKKKMELLKL